MTVLCIQYSWYRFDRNIVKIVMQSNIQFNYKICVLGTYNLYTTIIRISYYFAIIFTNSYYLLTMYENVEVILFILIIF